MSQNIRRGGIYAHKDDPRVLIQVVAIESSEWIVGIYYGRDATEHNINIEALGDEVGYDARYSRAFRNAEGRVERLRRLQDGYTGLQSYCETHGIDWQENDVLMAHLGQALRDAKRTLAQIVAQSVTPEEPS